MPRTLAQNAQYIANTIKPAIKSAIEAQGVTVPSTDSFLDYADRIAEIEGGGSGYQLKDLPTGAISTVNDAAPLPLNALKVSVEAWQEGSGDPSPSNVRPITGWDSVDVGVCGINLWDEEWEVGNINSSGELAPSDNRIRSKNIIAIKPQMQYRFVAPNNGAVFYYDKNQTFINWETLYANTTLTVPLNAQFMRFYMSYVYGTTYNNNVSINYPSTDTTYHAYNPNSKTTTIPLSSTCYDGELDVDTGKSKDTETVIVFDGSNDESWINVSALTSVCRAQIALPNAKTGSLICISNELPYLDSYTSDTVHFYVYNQYAYVFLPVSDLTEFRAWLANSPLQIKYELATPTTTQLAQPTQIRTLDGDNNIYADCGDIINGEYFVDEGAIDVRKVDYTATTSDYPATTKGRCFKPKYINNMNYVITPRASDGTWLDVDWTKDFEIQTAFKMLNDSAQLSLFTNGISNTNNEYSPTIFYTNNNLRVLISSGGGSWDLIYDTNFKPTLNTWYALKMTYTASTQALVVAISTDFETWTTLLSQTLGFTIQYNGASLIFGGRGADTQYWNPGNIIFDTFNTYIKDDSGEIIWGAFTGVFPS